MCFHCHGFTGQRESFNAFSLSWLRRAVGFFQCLFIVMIPQGNGILSMSFHYHGFTGQWGSFKVRHCHGFTGQWDSEGSGILYFNFFSLSWFHRAVGFFISMSFHCHGFTGQWDSLKAAGFFISMSFHCHGFTGRLDSFNVLSLSL